MSFKRITELIIFLYGEDNIKFNNKPITFENRRKVMICKSDFNHNIFRVLFDEYVEAFYYDLEKGIIEKRPIELLPQKTHYQLMHPCYNDHQLPINEHRFMRRKLFSGKNSLDECYFITFEELNKLLEDEWKDKSMAIVKKLMLLNQILYKDVANYIIKKLYLLYCDCPEIIK